MPAAVKLVPTPLVVAKVKVVDSAPITEGAKLTVTWQALPVAKVVPAKQVLPETTKSVVAPVKAPKVIGPPLAVIVSMPQVRKLPSPTLPQAIEVALTTAAPAVPDPAIEKKAPPVPKEPCVLMVTVAAVAPRMLGVEVIESVHEASCANNAFGRQVPVRAKSVLSELVYAGVPKVIGPPVAVTVIESGEQLLEPVPSPVAAQATLEAETVAVPQPVKSATLWLVAGAVPASTQKLSATGVPSDWVQVTVRVSLAAVLQVEEGADQLPALQV